MSFASLLAEVSYIGAHIAFGVMLAVIAANLYGGQPPFAH